MGDNSENFEELSLKIDQLREKFNQTYADQISSSAYAECDLERLQTDDDYAHCFLRHHRGNMDKAVAMVDTSLRWRNEMGLHELTEKSFPREIHDIGAIHFHSQDKKGQKILYFQVSKTKKDPEKVPTVKKFVAWWIDKHFLHNAGEKIVVLFDMTDAGLANMDMELIKYQIQCFTTFYPSLLDYMIIYEMPFILNAIWKIIKNILSAEQQKAVLFLKRSEIQNYIAPENLWVHMGGTDTFQYSYIPSEDSGIDIQEAVALSDTDTNSTPTKKKGASRDVFHGEFANISPSEELVFLSAGEAREIQTVLKITNTIQEPIAYKVKTTSPDGYRVRPSTGVIHPNNSSDVNVFLQQSHRDHMARDKFLIMLLKIGDNIPPQAKLNAMWKGPKIPNKYTEHRLTCTLRLPDEEFYDRRRSSLSEPMQNMVQMPGGAFPAGYPYAGGGAPGSYASGAIGAGGYGPGAYGTIGPGAGGAIGASQTQTTLNQDHTLCVDCQMGNIMEQQHRLEQRLTRMFTYQILIGALMIVAVIILVVGMCFGGRRNTYMSSSCSPFSILK